MKTSIIWMAGGAVAVAAWVFSGGGAGALAAAETAVKLPAPALDLPVAPTSKTTQTATFAGGCFWGVQAVFQHTQGVLNAVSGYAGGEASTAKYSIRLGSHRPGRGGAYHLRPDPGQLRQAAADLFFRRARPHHT